MMYDIPLSIVRDAARVVVFIRVSPSARFAERRLMQISLTPRTLGNYSSVEEDMFNNMFKTQAAE